MDPADPEGTANLTYHWKTGKWVKVSTKTVHYPTYKSAHKIAGWRIKGLPGWPEDA